MKKIIFTLVMLSAILSCEEEDLKPDNEFAGSYRLISDNPAIEIGFTVSEDGQIHNFGNNAYVKHASIQPGQESNNNITTFDKFDGGFGKIEILSRTIPYYRIVLIYNKFTDEGLSVYDVQIDISGEPFMVLPDRVFTRKTQ